MKRTTIILRTYHRNERPQNDLATAIAEDKIQVQQIKQLTLAMPHGEKSWKIVEGLFLRGLSQEALALELPISRSMISKLKIEWLNAIRAVLRLHQNKSGEYVDDRPET